MAKESICLGGRVSATFTQIVEGACLRLGVDDERIWIGGNLKAYSVNSAYGILLNLSTNRAPPETTDIFKNFSCNVPKKVLAFSWLMVLDLLPTRTNLLIRGVL